MKMKQISDSTIKITIQLEDLEERGMEIADFLVPQEKTEEFFYTILDELEMPESFLDSGMLSFRVTPKPDKLDDWFEAHFHNSISVAIMLITYGIAFIYLERREQVEPAVTELHKLPYRTALYIGLFQVLSLFPGTSRSGATIVGGLINGVSRPVVTEFTFYLGIPAMFGASLLKVGKFALSGHSLALVQLFILLVAMGVAFVVSMYAIRFLTDYVKNHDFTVFGKYRIVLGSILLLYGLFRIIF